MKKFIVFLFTIVAARAAAQAPSCTGGLGDPIVDITFGSGQGFGPALASGISNMTYVANACPEDGYYTIVHSVSGCYSPTWLNVAADHTGNPNGYFMLINASYQPSDFYVQTISGLCAGTNYQFAAWVLNMVSVPGEIEPNITFTVESTSGAVLGTYNTGDILSSGTVNWVQYGFYFNTPPGVSTVVLRMTNNASGGNGNDVALDDITFRATGPAILVTGSAGFADDSILLCQNDPRTIVFAATVESCYPTAVYQWQQSADAGVDWTDIPGATAASYFRSPTGTGNYQYRLTVAETGNIGIPACEVASTPAVVQVIGIPSPTVSIVSDTTAACAGMPVTFMANSTQGGSGPVYQWLLNGADAGNGGTVYTNSGLSGSDVVQCAMTSDAACVMNPMVVSNSISIAVTPTPVSSVSIAASANNICRDSPVLFTATPVNGGVAPLFQWTVNGVPVGADSGVFTDAALSNGDTVSCTMTAGFTCAQPAPAGLPVTMVVYPLPVIALTPDTVIEGGGSLTLAPLVSGVISSYQWSPATGLEDPGFPDPVATPVGSTVYRLTVVSADGCVASAAEAVEVYYRLAMPEAFTPNGDGRNDLFRVPPSIPVVVQRLEVYDRLGVRIYSSGGGDQGWDGRFGGLMEPAGEYVWMLVFENPLTKKIETAKGIVMLVR